MLHTIVYECQKKLVTLYVQICRSAILNLVYLAISICEYLPQWHMVATRIS
jgi:hypothetical protein